jgi:hypothetical protein
MNTKQIVQKILSHFIMACELDMALREKNIAVKNQSFELAIKWRDEENKIRAKMLTFEELQSLQKELENLEP